MGHEEDSVFLQRFSLVILGLVLFTVAIIFIANSSGPEPYDKNPSRMALTLERIQPVGDVYTDPAAAQAAAAAAPAAAPSTSASSAPGAVPASIDGEAIYNSVCMACHVTGAAGAPIPGSDLWAERASKGLEQLAYSAINGINAMPAKGGRVDLSDEEVTAAVEYMLAQ